MSQTAAVRNPFLLLLQPEIVIAAIEKSERLAQLVSRQCRPLDRLPAAAAADAAAAEAMDADGNRDDAEPEAG